MRTSIPFTPEFRTVSDEFVAWRLQSRHWRQRLIAVVNGAAAEVNGRSIFLTAVIAERPARPNLPHVNVLSGPADGSAKPQTDYSSPEWKTLYDANSGLFHASPVRLHVGPAKYEEFDLLLPLLGAETGRPELRDYPDRLAHIPLQIEIVRGPDAG
jgi:hypothetical protein